MQITKNSLPNQEVELTIVLDSSDLADHKEKAMAELAKHVKMKGFRPGKAPANLIEQQVGAPAIFEATLDIAIPKILPKVIEDEKLELIASPQVSVKELEPVTLVVKVALMPKIDTSKLKNLKIEKEDVKPTKEEIEGTIYEFQKLHASYEDVEGPVKLKQRVEIDFEGFDEEGNSLDGTVSKNHPIVVGDNLFIPGFEDELVGLNIGDEKEFMITFPADYRNVEFQSKKVKFKVKVNRIENVTLPEVNEELSEKVIQKKLGADEFKQEITDQISKQKEQKEAQRQQAKLFEELAQKADIEMSTMLVEAELDYLIHQHKHEVEHYGIQWADYVKMIKEQGKDLREDRRNEAEQRVKVRFIIKQLVEEHKLSPEADEVLNYLKEHGAPADVINEGTKEFGQAYDVVLLNKIFDLYLQK